MSRIRTKLHKGDLRVLEGPSDPGTAARQQDKVIATTRHSRFLAAVAEGVVAALSEGSPAQIVEAVNGAPAPRRLSRRQAQAKRLRIEELEAAISELEQFLSSASSPAVREGLEKTHRAHRREALVLKGQLKADKVAARSPDPYHPTEVTDLLRGLADVIRGEAESEALSGVLHDLRLTRVETLALTFQTSVFLPASKDEGAVVEPVEFTVENTHRVPTRVRAAAMARLCLEQAWPVSTVAAGVPLVCSFLDRQRVASGLSRILFPLVGGKAASVLGGCEAPEVIAVISRHYGLGKPDLEVDRALEERILNTYVNGTPPGPKGWVQTVEDSQLAEAVKLIHTNSTVPADQIQGPAHIWERRRYLRRSGTVYTRPACRCGSEDLALVPTPEPQGLVCLRCRRDSSGLEIPESWNPAVRNRAYWEALGYDLAVPSVPGLPVREIVTEPLRLR